MGLLIFPLHFVRADCIFPALLADSGGSMSGRKRKQQKDGDYV